MERQCGVLHARQVIEVGAGRFVEEDEVTGGVVNGLYGVLSMISLYGVMHTMQVNVIEIVESCVDTPCSPRVETEIKVKKPLIV